jgi:cellobiose phosphorylase
MARAVNFSWKTKGPHGLPKIGFADWNDCLNLLGPKKQAESVMIAQMLVLAARDLAEMAMLRGKKNDAKKYNDIAAKMAKQINKVAWDGAWYKRAFMDDKKPVGSKVSKLGGKIFLETQPWAVMSGTADKKRAKTCMDSVYGKLFTKHGIMVMQPGYKEFYHLLGSITVYPPGLKENGAIFCHPNPWAMVAECVLGRGERAFEYYKAILPAAKNDAAELRKTEPYVYCQMVAGKEHTKPGEGKNSWLTGTAAWNFVAISQWILGIRPVYSGLMIDPCIPRKWKGFKVSRLFRGVTYIINVRNPKGVNKGIRSVTVDGKTIKGNILPLFKKGTKHSVEAVMG